MHLIKDYTFSCPHNDSLSQRNFASLVERVDQGLLRCREKTLRMLSGLENEDVSVNSDRNSYQKAQKSLSQQ